MNWKKLFIVSAGWGLATAFGLAIITGVAVWYRSRPKAPKPWNTLAIEAQYDYVGTENDDHTLVFNYTLENETDYDYRVTDSSSITINSILEKEKSLSPLSDRAKIDYPVFIPAKKRVSFPIHINYATKLRDKSTEDVANFVSKEAANLNGFDLLDESTRYEIIFPAGWKSSSQQQSKEQAEAPPTPPDTQDAPTDLVCPDGTQLHGVTTFKQFRDHSNEKLWECIGKPKHR